MPLIPQLQKLGAPGNPEGVCTEAASITAYVLMTGPRSIEETTEVTLPLAIGVTRMNPQLISGGNECSSELDVSKLPSGVPGIWTWNKENEGTEQEMARKGSVEMLKWLKDSAPPGVYVGTMEPPGGVKGEDTHVFNFAKTEEGKVYLIDSSIQNFQKIKGTEDVDMSVIAQIGREDESVELSLETKVNEVDELDREEVDSDNLNVGESVDLTTERKPEEKSSKVVKGMESDDDDDDQEQSQEEEVRMAPFFKVYGASDMKLDYCGALHPDCALELQQSLKRSVREDYSPSVKTSTGQKITVTHN